jgi:hypothetical protein
MCAQTPLLWLCFLAVYKRDYRGSLSSPQLPQVNPGFDSSSSPPQNAPRFKGVGILAFGALGIIFAAIVLVRGGALGLW